MKHKYYWASYNIDNVRGTFGLRGSSRSESDQSRVNTFVSHNLEGIHGPMQQLMSWQHKLMLKNNENLFEQYFRNESDWVVTCYRNKSPKLIPLRSFKKIMC